MSKKISLAAVSAMFVTFFVTSAFAQEAAKAAEAHHCSFPAGSVPRVRTAVTATTNPSTQHVSYPR